MKDPCICHCDLTGELHVVDAVNLKTCCEVCRLDELHPLTAECANKAFEWYRQRCEDYGRVEGNLAKRVEELRKRLSGEEQ